MTVTEAMAQEKTGTPEASKLKTFMALVVIYVVWGSTFLAIRVAVEQIPPLLAAGIRFTIAGLILYAWARMRGVPRLTGAEWRNLALVGVLMFTGTYSALFWAEKTVPSGIASVLVATLPLWTILIEGGIVKKERLRWPLVLAILLGFAGVVVITRGSGNAPLRLWPCLAILGGEICWALGAVLSRVIRLPSSKTVTAGSEMMLGGVLLLALSGLTGESRHLPAHLPLQAGLAILYLILAGSILAYGSFVWLLGRMPATRVSSHAYVNPVVALALGYWVRGESIGLQTLLGALLVFGSVFLILRGQTAH